MISCKSKISILNVSQQAEFVKKQAETMAKVFIEKDYKTYMKFMYPKAIEIMGGETNMIKILETMPYEIIKASYEKPEKFVYCNNEIQCIIIENLEIKVRNGRLVMKNNLIGISKDTGKNWYFLDVPGTTISSIKQSFPNLCNELEIVEMPKSIRYND